MIEQLLPEAAASAESRTQLPELKLFPEEERVLGAAVEKRRREFVAGRACARAALLKLGVPATPIGGGPHGEPLWPAAVVGSITHCRGYTASAVAYRHDLLALGIDAERNEALPAGVLAQIAFGTERERCASAPGVHGDRLLFSAKEAVYKAWFPITGRTLSFADVRIALDLEAGQFRAALLVAAPLVEGVPLTELRGRWSAEEDVILTAVALPRQRARWA